MIKFLLYLFFCLFFISSCNNGKVPLPNTESVNYCGIIDTIIFNYENKLSNHYMNNNLSLIANKTGIPDHAFKGTFGYTYLNDSIFYSDMRKYQKVLNCQ